MAQYPEKFWVMVVRSTTIFAMSTHRKETKSGISAEQMKTLSVLFALIPQLERRVFIQVSGHFVVDS
ncbi:hypothetical protein [Paraburkholderia sp. MM5477-R1]|uniref:hypothetical protein n=1 Tax=Paraburkholderia sp. MM5477-R1 TaxID=2991062 RepID=UPI003D2298C1